MSPKARVFIGVISTALLLGMGAILVADQRSVVGWVLIVLGVLRGIAAFQQLRALSSGE